MRRSDLAVLVLVGVGLAAPATIAARRSQDEARVTACASNLRQLWTMMANYAVQYGGDRKLMSTDTGDRFWLRMSTPPTVLIGRDLADIYQCPVENCDDGGCDYRGPATDVNQYKDGDPVGADAEGNHSTGGILRGGNVLLRSGDVRTVSHDDALWERAREKTCGGNAAAPQKPLLEVEKQKTALTDIGHIVVAVWMYQESTGKFPRSLGQLVSAPDSPELDFGFTEGQWPQGGYLMGKRVPKDPWGNEYFYEVRDNHPFLCSFGSDGKQGGEGFAQDLTMEDVFPTPDRRCRRRVREWDRLCRNYYVMAGERYPSSGNRSFVRAMEEMIGRLGKEHSLEEVLPREVNQNGELIDPWGRPYVYRNNKADFPKNQNDPTAYNKQTFDFYSVGPNGVDEKGSGDDIGNW